MGGAQGVVWRNVVVSTDMVDPLNSLAASVGPVVTPIPGYGSYTNNDASAGTDSGGGHVDIYAGDVGGWTESERIKFVLNARERGFLAFPRYKKWWSPIRKKYLYANWATHFHLIKKDTPDLSSGARSQLSQWYAGSNGLAGFWWNGVWTYDPDPYDRTYLRQTWTQFLEGDAMTPEQERKLDDLIARVRSVGQQVAANDDKNQLRANAVARLVETLIASENLDDAARDAELQSIKQMLADLDARHEPPTPPLVNPWPAITGPVYGFDHSSHQTIAETQAAVDSGKYKFAIIKATEGMGWTSDTYAQQIEIVRAGELMSGAFHFWWPTNKVIDDLDNFTRTAKLRLGELPVLDAEHWDQKNNYADMKNLPREEDRLAWALEWLQLAEDRFGCVPWIYLNWDWIKRFRFASGQAVKNADGSVTIRPETQQTELWKELTRHPLWIADNKPAGQNDTVSGGWNGGIVCHQYTSTPFDQNYMASEAPHEIWWANGIKKVA